MPWWAYPLVVVNLLSVGLWALVGLTAFLEMTEKFRHNRRQRARDVELAEAGYEGKILELLNLREENRRLRGRIKDYEKGKNRFGEISP